MYWVLSKTHDQEICVWEKQGEAKRKEKVLGMQCRMMPENRIHWVELNILC